MGALGQYIKEKRGEVSLRKLAKEIGISHSYLWDVEQGNRKVSLKMVRRICLGLFKYTGGDLSGMYDMMIRQAGLESPERTMLRVLFITRDHENLRGDMYKALYAELDAMLFGENQPNRYEQSEIWRDSRELKKGKI